MSKARKSSKHLNLVILTKERRSKERKKETHNPSNHKGDVSESGQKGGDSRTLKERGVSTGGQEKKQNHN